MNHTPGFCSRRGVNPLARRKHATHIGQSARAAAGLNSRPAWSRPKRAPTPARYGNVTGHVGIHTLEIDIPSRSHPRPNLGACPSNSASKRGPAPGLIPGRRPSGGTPRHDLPCTHALVRRHSITRDTPRTPRSRPLAQPETDLVSRPRPLDSAVRHPQRLCYQPGPDSRGPTPGRNSAASKRSGTPIAAAAARHAPFSTRRPQRDSLHRIKASWQTAPED